MDAPNAPNPANPNAQNPVAQNQEQNQDQNQDQAPVGQVPAHIPVQPSTTTGPSTTSSCWCCAHSSDYL